MSSRYHTYSDSPGHGWTSSFIILFLASILVSIVSYSPVPLILPATVLLGFFIVQNVKFFYCLFFFLLPFSVELDLPGGFATDMPSEPLMLVLTLIGILLIIKSLSQSNTRYFRHPVSLLLIVHLVWIIVSAMNSSQTVFSFKFFAAKLWYVIPFYFLPLLLLERPADFRRLFRYFISGLLIAVLYVMIRHGGMGFSFKSINEAVRPIFRNHVNYGVMLVIALPFLYYLWRTGSYKRRIQGLLVILLLLSAIYLTYTRAAQICIILSVLAFFVIRWRQARAALILATAGLVLGLAYLVSHNNYLDLAPDYTKAIEHKKFDNLVEATTKMEDISTVERFYRWIAGFNMIAEKPLTGFGPATFYSEYKPYTITSYKTYVSDNPERSGIHNYYLMTAVEQGVPGLLIFVSLCVLVILFGEKNYHNCTRAEDRSLVMAASVCFILIMAVLLINDLLEADKVGPFFFLSMAVIVYFDLRNAHIKTKAQHDTT